MNEAIKRALADLITEETNKDYAKVQGETQDEWQECFEDVVDHVERHINGILKQIRREKIDGWKDR